MSQTNATIAILTSDKPERYRNMATHCIRHERFNQDVQTLPQTLNSDYDNLHLVIDGGHGNAHSRTGEPLVLNNQSIANIRQQVQALKNKGLRFQSITLTPCFSAACVPLFKDLLTDEGLIFCQTLSSTESANTLLEKAAAHNHDLFSLGFAVLDCKIQGILDRCREMVNHTQCFISDAVYTKQDNTLHRFKSKNLDKELDAHNKLIHAGQFRDCTHELTALENHLGAHDIQTSDESIDADAMEQTIRNTCLRFKKFPMKRTDFDEIQRLDRRIFPADARQIDLRTYYHPDYSWLMVDRNNPDEKIVGYIFARPEGNNGLLIGNLGADPDAGPQGIGSKLLKTVLSQAHQEQKTVRLEVNENNTRAIHLYRKLGFVETGTNGDHLIMSHGPKASQQHGNANTNNTDHNKALHYSFMLKLAVFSLGVCLLLAAAVFFPPLGLTTTLGIKAIAGISTNMSYAISGASATVGFASLGFFSYMLGKDSVNFTQDNQADNRPPI